MRRAISSGKMSQLQDPTPPPDVETLNTNIVFLLLGIYGWEYFQSLHIEWALVCGRLAFPTSPYPGGTDCLPVVLTISVSGVIALGSSSMNFLTRTWVVWKDSRLVHALLVLLALGQWTMLAVVMMIRLINVNGVDQVLISHPQVNAATNLYSE
ncbi:hypothetical protein OG21DRAFT_937355 [Imleria badia]|nr:hypothetical protein OG21DRAFT_937355 [Imleria badia]